MEPEDANHTFLSAAINQQRAAVGVARMFLDNAPAEEQDEETAAIAAAVIAAADDLVERIRTRLQKPL